MIAARQHRLYVITLSRVKMEFDDRRSSTKFLGGKRAMDLVLAASLSLLSWPLMVLAIALVKLTSPGPGIYSQTRSGRHGRPFRMYKIRTMTHDCERLTGAQWAVPNDPRVTAVGRFLRETHIDELPQLWNVLRGEMSLVGPRPERPEIVAKLEQHLPDYRDRMRVLPGVTGLAQVQLPPDTSLECVRRKLACDLCYTQRLDIQLDLKILLATGLKVAGVPVGVRCRLLRIPIVRIAGDSTDGREAPAPADAQMQTA
jgi:lipopolysaccharide/colanic/teichoic acid biosynthesis glycosyltransferase